MASRPPEWKWAREVARFVSSGRDELDAPERGESEVLRTVKNPLGAAVASVGSASFGVISIAQGDVPLGLALLVFAAVLLSLAVVWVTAQWRRYFRFRAEQLHAEAEYRTSAAMRTPERGRRDTDHGVSWRDG